MPHTLLHLDDVERIHAGGAGWWRPIRRVLGVTAFGINAYTADDAGGRLIESHDETSFGAGRHEEMHLVLAGRTTFTVAGRELDAPAGSLLLVEAGTERGAVRCRPGTGCGDARRASVTILAVDPG